MALCLAAGALSATLATTSFTLAWVHSIEKVRWEEDWRVEATGLRLIEARVLGSGAGMEAPEGAVLERGVWHYAGRLAPLPELLLAHSPYTRGYEICFDGKCRQLASWLPGLPDTASLALRPCAGNG